MTVAAVASTIFHAGVIGTVIASGGTALYNLAMSVKNITLALFHTIAKNEDLAETRKDEAWEQFKSSAGYSAGYIGGALLGVYFAYPFVKAVFGAPSPAINNCLAAFGFQWIF